MRDDLLPRRCGEGVGSSLPWIRVSPGSPYFETEAGAPWTPIGQNDAISWVELAPLWQRRNLPAVERHLRRLRAHGVTVLRLMLEYADFRNRYLEEPCGTFVPDMVRLWDDLFTLCETVGLRIMLTPFDTFWTWVRWWRHPYNARNGGPLASRSRLLLCPDARAAIKARLTFAATRWGGSGALFAWDLWNEIHPAHAEDTADNFPEFIHDVSDHVRRLETRLYGRAHPQTVSLFGPELEWRAHMSLKDPVFRHPDLHFASLHIYGTGPIDDPADTVGAALVTGKIVRMALAEIADMRPFLDSEHGPIHTHKDKRITLTQAFDDEYFRHMQWAHLASGGAGGGMRWPNRKPHVLTAGMRRAQRATAGFLDLVDWPRFRRVNLNEEIAVSHPGLAVFGCGDEAQAVVWLLRTDTVGRHGRVAKGAAAIRPRVTVPGLAPGSYTVRAWDTRLGRPAGEEFAVAGEGGLVFETPPFAADLALAVRRG